MKHEVVVFNNPQYNPFEIQQSIQNSTTAVCRGSSLITPIPQAQVFTLINMYQTIGANLPYITYIQTHPILQ